MAQRGKRYKGDYKKVEKGKSYPLAEAITIVKGFAKSKFDQTIELCMHLGIDARQPDQSIRGSVSLPNGIGKSKRVVAFCGADKVEGSKGAGAVEAGGEELVKKIEGGWMEFDVAVASPEMMRVVSKLGRQLGPRGLMPSPKAGTVTPDVEQAVKDYSAGKGEYRNDSGGNVHVAIGKQSFAGEKLGENAEFFINMVEKMKPAAAKGQYVKKVIVCGTMTPSVLVER